MGDKIKVFLAEFDEGSFGYDLQILDESATVGDYLAAVEAFQAKTMADCFGCDGCCHERVPLMLCDFYYSRYFAEGGRSLAQWLERSGARLEFCGEAVDLQLARKPNGACFYLDEEQKCCAAHMYRTFACRSHCCLVKSERAEAIRALIINSGEDELVRRLLQELSAEQKPDFLPEQNRLQNVLPEDYLPNGFTPLAGEDWRKAKLADFADSELWAELLAD